MCSIMWKVEKPVKRVIIRTGTPVIKLEDKAIIFALKYLRKLSRKKKPEITAQDFYDGVSGRLT